MGSPATLANGKPGLALRMGVKKAGPVVSDNGNFIIDAPFGDDWMRKPAEVNRCLPQLWISLTHLATKEYQAHHWGRRSRLVLQHGKSGFLR
jgi:hypothetical protein